MLSTILNLTTTGNEKPIVAWLRMLSYISLKTNMYTDAVIHGTTVITPWVNKILKILNAIDAESLNKLPPAQRYAKILMDCDIRLINQLAPNYSVSSLQNCFANPVTGEVVQEYMIPCRSEFPLMDLPLGKRLDQWKDVNPINIIYNDSTELCSYILKMQYQYKRSAPKMIIAAIDLPALAMKYCVYVDEMQQTGKSYNASSFIKEYLMNNFYNDCVRCYIFTLIKNFFDNEDLEPTSSLIVDFAAVKSAQENLDLFYHQLKKKNYSVNDFIYTKWIPDLSGPISIYKYMKWFDRHITLPDFAQARYLKFLTQYPLLYILVKLYNLSDKPNDKIIKRALYFKLYNLNRSGVLSLCNNRKLKSKLHHDIRELIDLCRPDEFSPSLS